MTLKTKLLILSLIVSVISLAVWGFAEYERDVGKRDLLIEQTERSADQYREASKVNTARYAKAVRTYTRSEIVYKKLRDSIHITDTVEVLRTLAAADTAIKACSVVVTTCEEVQVSLRGQIAAQDSTITLLKKQRPGVASGVFRLGTALGIGFVLGNVVTNHYRR